MRRLSSVMMVNPVVVVSKQKQTKGTNKQNLATKATKKQLKSGSSWYGCDSLHRLSVEYQDTGGVIHESYPEYLMGRSPDDRFRKYVPVTNSTRGKEKKW